MARLCRVYRTLCVTPAMQRRTRIEKFPMSRQFHYYDKGWESEVLECPICHWKGKFHQGATCTYPDFTDCQCPNCDIFTRPMLAMVMHPTRQEMLEDSGPPEDKARAERLIAADKAFWAVAQTKPEQLPDIPGDGDLYLTWDADYSEGKDQPSLLNS